MAELASITSADVCQSIADKRGGFSLDLSEANVTPPRTSSFGSSAIYLSFWLLGCSVLTAFGVATSSMPGYALRHYETDDGLPANNITSIVQTRDGYLWLGT